MFACMKCSKMLQNLRELLHTNTLVGSLKFYQSVLMRLAFNSNSLKFHVIKCSCSTVTISPYNMCSGCYPLKSSQINFRNPASDYNHDNVRKACTNQVYKAMTLSQRHIISRNKITFLHVHCHENIGLWNRKAISIIVIDLYAFFRLQVSNFFIILVMHAKINQNLKKFAGCFTFSSE